MAADNQCQFESDVQGLVEVQNNPNLSYPQNVQEELRLRKDILRKIVDCSVTEVQKLEDTTRNLPEPNNNVAFLKSKFLDRLGEAVDYYNLQKSKVDDVGLQGSKDLAKNLRTWRANTYAPLAADAGNLIVWVKNQDLFATADWRFRQITQTVNSLNLLDQEDIRTYYNEAQQRLNQAKALNDDAGLSLGRTSSPDDTANKIKASLSALSDTYQTFFDLSTAVKKLLPI